MKFYLYLAGAKLPKQYEDKLRLGGYDRLYSQFNDRAAISEYADERAGKLLIDSGAFTAHKKCVEICVDEYIKYLNINTTKFDWFVQLDQIPGKFGEIKTRDDYFEAAKMSLENYKYMVQRLDEPHKLLPVFHYGDDLDVLKELLEYKLPDGTVVQYMGISPANDTHVNIKRVWIDRVFSTIQQSNNANIKTHALGMTTFEILEKYPFTSADSTSWKLSAAYGGIMTPYGVVTVSTQQRHVKDHLMNFHPDAKREIVAFINKQGFELSNLEENFSERAFFNAMYSKEWAINYKFSGSAIRKKQLF